MREIEINSYRNEKDRCLQFKELLRAYFELQSRSKALEEIFSINDSGSNQNFYRIILFGTTQKEI